MVMKNKAIIMSIEGRFAVAYTEDGQFIKIPRKRDHQVGQILCVEKKQPLPWKFAARWQMAAAAVAVMLIIFMGMFYPFSLQKAEAYISLGLNSGGAELWVDRNNKVIKIRYSDAMKDLEKLDLKGEDVYEAVSVLTSAAKNAGLLDENQENLLLVDFADLTEERRLQETKLKEAIMTGLSSGNSPNFSGVMVMNGHDKEFINKARELGMTASQYNVYEKSRAKGLILTAEQIKSGHMRSVLNGIGTTPEELFGIENTMQKNTAGKGRTMTSPGNRSHMSPVTNPEREHYETPVMPNNDYHQQAPANMQNNQMPSHQTDTFGNMTNSPPKDSTGWEMEPMMQSNSQHGEMHRK